MISAIEVIAAIAVPSLAQAFGPSLWPKPLAQALVQAQLMVDISRLTSTDYLAMAPEQ
jgi:hypothetical protein